MSTSTTNNPDVVRLERNVSWEAFEAFLVARGEKPPRVAYLEGTLETMSPSTSHEHLRKALAMVVEEYIDGLGARWTGVGSWLMKNKKAKVGLEPDECYVFGDKKKKRPDLAVEVIWTSGSVKKLEIYRQLGVPEVWFWKKHRFSIHVLGQDKRYGLRDRSVCLPDFDFARATEIMKLPLLSDVKRALRERR
ncbi:MAG TPA: Uma2 family endonuclease [Kofleriaceae bacterium]